MLTQQEIYSQYYMGGLNIHPFDEKHLNPNSYDLHLDSKLLVYTNAILDSKKENETEEIIIPGEGLVLEQGKFYLGSTVETTSTDLFIPALQGKSSLARLGLSIHETAGFGDIGFSGKWTLEITPKQYVWVYPNMRIAQIYFFKPDGIISHLYNSRYQHQNSVTPSKSYQNLF